MKTKITPRSLGYFGEGAESRYIEMLRVGLKNGADINGRNSDGHTVLMLSAALGYLNAVKMLLENGADPDLRVETLQDEGDTAFLIAASQGQTNVAKFLLHHAHHAINTRMEEKNRNNETALELAVMNGHLDTVLMLLGEGADINHTHHTFGGGDITVLMLAIWESQMEIARALVERGADVNSKSLNRRSGELWAPLRFAALVGDGDMMRFLLDRGAEPDIGDQAIVMERYDLDRLVSEYSGKQKAATEKKRLDVKEAVEDILKDLNRDLEERADGEKATP